MKNVTSAQDSLTVIQSAHSVMPITMQVAHVTDQDVDTVTNV
jgi:hypothetical protein